MGSRTQPPAAWHKLSVRGADHDAAGNCRHSAGIIVLTPALRPKPDPKEALVKVEAVSFNYRDLLILENGRCSDLYPCLGDAGGIRGISRRHKKQQQSPNELDSIQHVNRLRMGLCWARFAEDTTVVRPQVPECASFNGFILDWQ